MKEEEFRIVIRSSFDAAHSISISGSNCERLHGHRWQIEAVFSGPLQSSGIVSDFLEMEKELKGRVISKLDHINLNELFEKPTTELICRWIWSQLKPIGVVEIRLWETPDFSVIYKGE